MLLNRFARIFTAAVLGVAAAGAVAPGPAAALPPPEVTVAVDRQSATVGDPITLTLQVRYDTTLSLALAFPGRTIGSFDLLSDSVISAATDAANSGLYERRWRLAAFQTGTFWIPALKGGVADTAGEVLGWQSDSIKITIASVLTAADDSADLKGLKDPFEAAEAINAWWYVLAGFIVALAAGLFVWRRRRHPAAAVAPPPIPPWESALAELRSLRNTVDPESDGGRLWYFRLSEILRRYLDGRYGWQSIDQTTSEILRRLQEAPFHDLHRERVHEFFKVADMVRYARAHAKVGRPQNDWQWLEGFVEETRLSLSTDTDTGAPGGDSPAAAAAPGSSPARKHEVEEERL